MRVGFNCFDGLNMSHCHAEHSPFLGELLANFVRTLSVNAVRAPPAKNQRCFLRAQYSLARIDDSHWARGGAVKFSVGARGQNSAGGPAV
jgi:hypothetical protein